MSWLYLPISETKEYSRCVLLSNHVMNVFTLISSGSDVFIVLFIGTI
jgi:hypothetical protein